MDAPLDIVGAIRLAVAPVFLLAGVGAFLNVVAMRLGRVVDRARSLEAKLIEREASVDDERIRDELRGLDRRMALAQSAIMLISTAALLICVLVATLFIVEFTHVAAEAIIAALFILTMGVLIGGLVFFLAEVRLATRLIRVRSEFFMKDDPAQ
ncbi:MAG: DUF2721 domain-containing protein [Pseudomonadota bacterium]